MTCRDLLPDLRDHAAGAEPTQQLGTHLLTCGACAAALRAERRVLDEIDAVVGALGQTEPSPAFLSRARTLTNRPAAYRSRLPLFQTAAALLAVGLCATVLLRFVSIDTPAPVPSALGSAASPLAASPPLPKARAVDPLPRPAPPPRSVPPPHSVPAPRPVRVAAAIVPPGQEALIRHFAALVESGVIDLPPQLPETAHPGLPLQPAPELSVTPLTIAPIEAEEAPSEE